MNKAAIKNFAVGARKKLLSSVKDKAGRIGITIENITDAIIIGEGYAIFPNHIGMEVTLYGKEIKQRENLVNRIKEKGYESVIEEVAYTWFNRIIAVRFMELNDYLPSRIRVLSSETKGKFEPDIATQAPNIDLDFTSAEKEEILTLKDKNEADKLFHLLFIKQCNALGKILPELFENTSRIDKDYTEILFDISWNNEDGVIRNLLSIDEADFLEAVEIIGWMYQSYIAEPKDTLINAKNRYKTEEVPFVTQLFTSDWIVRYMVENSLGRLWLEGHSNKALKSEWKYYLDEAEQEPDVMAELEKIRSEYKNINPEDIKVIDLCMGSGHILVYAFEVLIQIYESCGYTARDAASLIIEKNIYGLDIDDRAYQLSYLAIMMKGRKYDKRFLTKNITPNLCSIQESNAVNREIIRFISQGNEEFEKNVTYILDIFADAKEYGSILDVKQVNFSALEGKINQIEETFYDNFFDNIYRDEVISKFMPLLKQAKIMAYKYEIVCTNPPYLNAKYMPNKLKDFIETNYTDYKSDMFSAFMIKCSEICKKNGHIGMITPYVWMFISSYEKLRSRLLNTMTISSLVQLEYNAFEAACVPVCTFTLKNYKCNISGEYIKLSEFKGIEVQAPKTLEAVNNRDCGFRFTTYQDVFSKMLGMPIAYWVSDSFLKIFVEGKGIGKYANAKKGLVTGNDALYLKLWYEVEKTNFSAFSSNYTKWKPLNKGGTFKKWYGNNDYVVNWGEDGTDLANHRWGDGCQRSSLRNSSYFFREGITWTYITSGTNSFRYYPKGFVFAGVGPGLFPFKPEELNYFLAYCNSIVFTEILKMIGASTISLESGEVEKAPIMKMNDLDLKNQIDKLTESCINLAQTDWDSFESSWDFKTHPLIAFKYTEEINQDNIMYVDDLYDGVEMIVIKKGDCPISIAYDSWERFTDKQFYSLKSNEEELNRIFIGIYGLQDELTPDVADKDVTIRKADLERDIKSFISYAVGCMFGRYSLDVDGLTYAGGQWDGNMYKTFIPDNDNVLPITDEEYFGDDIVSRFVDFVKVAYGVETLEENLDFIAKALGNKGDTSREVIRKYFLKDFYKDHVKTYKKRPIYWMFDSGNENGFKALVYQHRYNEDTVGRVRTDYLHKTQAAIENAIASCDIVLESNAPASDKAKDVKQKEKLVKQLAETRIYDQAIAHIAHQRISLDLDDGVVVNYAKFQDVVVSSEGKKAIKVDLLGKV